MAAEGVDRIELWAGPAAGVLGAVVTMAGIAMADIVGPEAISPLASASTIARVIAEKRDQLQLGTTVLMVGLFFLVWFFVHLQTRLNPTRSTRWFASVASVGGLIVVIFLALDVALVRAATQIRFTGPDEVIPKALVIFEWDYWRAFAPFISAHFLAAGIAIVHTSLLPKLIGWGAIGVALLPLLFPPGLMTIIFLLWMLVLSTGLLVKGIRST